MFDYFKFLKYGTVNYWLSPSLNKVNNFAINSSCFCLIYEDEKLGVFGTYKILIF